ncbi:DUF3742 family protein [Klebsiella pneumoniae]|uniref:DUF3742 family protein n=1 Tax=Klebsiella pneumoniae TaxID=573 RepID=UPI001ABCE78A|nr:DUF3742 family protein [Klebsiella pneumoniae]MBO3721227.1 DUF3742 family protein [Klebsiella pneumoniae]HCM5830653.1 DUF3742 family protein [Klebsiella pneumoniae]
MQQYDTQKQRTAWRLGQWLGHRYRALLRQEARFAGWLAAQGVPLKVARWLPLTVKLAAGLVLLYVAFWLALLFLGIVVLANASVSHTHGDEDDDWPLGGQADHRKRPGYDPNLYNDAPDSRYYDPRYDDD